MTSFVKKTHEKDVVGIATFDLANWLIAPITYCLYNYIK